MKKRRIASTRHMSKDDKRRLQLNKRPENKEETKKSKHAMFARPDGSKMFVRANGNEAVRTPLNKRLIAVILAIVMVVGLIPAGIFIFKPKADEFYTLNPVSMYTRINGVMSNSADTEIEAGQISDNIGNVSVSLPDGAEFVKAILLEADGVTETEIAAVGNIDDKDFYSLYEEDAEGNLQAGDIGTSTSDGQKLVLVYANKYNLHIQKNGEGTFVTSAGSNNYIYAGEDFRVYQVDPDTDYKASNITYTTPYTNGTISVKSGSATVKSSEIVGDLTVVVNFTAITSYSITDASYAKGLGNGGIAEEIGETTVSTSDLNSSSFYKKRWMPENITANGSKTFYLYSDSNTGGSEYLLNMLRINGTEIEVSAVDTAGATGTLSTGETITVALVSDGTSRGLTWLDNKAGTSKTDRDVKTWSSNGDGTSTVSAWKKKRTIYSITVTNAHSNLSVEYNFKQKSSREMILKDLNGISETAAAKEKTELLDHEYYFTQASSNVYKAYYDQSGASWRPSANLYLYRVKAGYNPYNITADVYYVADNGTVSAIADEHFYKEVGLPEVVISKAIADDGSGYSDNWQYFDSSKRYWGYYSGQQATLINSKTNDGLLNKGTDYLLTYIGKNNSPTWYAVGIHQNSSKNQQLWLNAQPYNYYVQLDLDSGSLSSTDGANFTADGNYYVSNSAVHIDDEKAYTYLPSEEPTRDGYYFEGWQLVDDGNDAIGDPLLSGERITISEETIENAIGEVEDDNQYFRFVAIWKAKEVASKTTATVNILVEDPSGSVTANDKTYTQVYTSSSIQYVGDAVVLNNHSEKLNGKAAYYYMNTASNTVTDLVNQTDANPNPNILNIYYDYKMYDLTVTNMVLGYPETQEYEVTITLTPDEDSPLADISAVDAETLFISSDSTVTGELTKNADGTFTYVVNMKNSDAVVLSLPYNWEYSIVEAENAEDYTTEIDPASSGKMTKKADAEIVNMQNNTGFGTEKTIELQSDGTYTITLKSWATGQTFSKPVSTATPLDIVMVVDQSGSMGTEDMATNLEYVPVRTDKSDDTSTIKTKWTIEEATGGGEQYYYLADDGKYYPVKAKEGALYEQASSVKANHLFGEGHDGDVSLNIFNWENLGSPVFFNVPTDYYYLYNGEIKKVYCITVGASAQYCMYAYIYTNPTTETSYGQYGTGEEWKEVVKWFNLRIIRALLDNGNIADLWHAKNMYNSTTYFKAMPKDILYINSNGTLSSDGSADSADNAHLTYSWIRDANTISGLYQVKEGTTYNGLYYNNGTEDKPIGNTIYLEGSSVYSGVLYRVKGKSRVTALQENIASFVDEVAKSAKKSGADHRMAIIGFAGNKVPAASSGKTAYDSTKYDYTNTGLFLNGSFKNYQTVSGGTQASTEYINKHYYTSVSGGHPVRYFGSNWYELIDSGDSATTWSDSAYSGSKYTPSYTDLDQSNYQNALVEIYDENDSHFYDTTSHKYSETNTNGINDQLDQAISEFGNYGGTYTSYGMTMANNIFRYDTKSSEDRQRVIVVFTDGEPGASSFDSSIAGEATVDSDIAKLSRDSNGYGAKVFTIGLFKEDPSTQVEKFMKELSSEYSATLSSVNGGSLNKGSLSIGTAENPKAYYYKETDGNGNETGKTYALTAWRNGESTLGWWITDVQTDGSVVYTKVTPASSSGAGSQKFYNRNGDSVQSGWDTSGGTTYYTTSSSSTRKPIRYEYRWYDSNNGIRDPIGTDNEFTTNTVQFYELGTAVAKSPTDTTTYYHRAANASSLTSIFNQVTNSIVSLKVDMPLNTDNSLMQDVITDNFDVSSASVSAKAVQSKKDSSGNITETSTETPVTSGVTLDKDTKTVTVEGWDYSANYIGADRADNDLGSKLVVTITGLKPLTTGTNLPSNTSDSGVYEKLFEDASDSSKQTGTQMLQNFDIPKVNRLGYTLVTDGDDKSAKYTVKLKLLDDEGNALTATQYELLNETTPLASVTPDEHGYVTWVTDITANGKNDDVKTDTVVLEDIFRDLPDGYKVYAKVTRSGGDENTYEYSLKLNNKSTTSEGVTTPDWNTPFEVVNGDEIEINSTRNTVSVKIDEVTKGADGEADYSDPEKDFDVIVTLKDLDRDKVTGTYTGVTFTDGVAHLTMRNGQSRTIEIPSGYSIAIDVNKDTQDTYEDTYKWNGEDVSGNKLDSTAVTASSTTITVINTIHEPVVTGLLGENASILGAVLGVVAAIGLAAAGVYVYGRRRKRLTN